MFRHFGLRRFFLFAYEYNSDTQCFEFG